MIYETILSKLKNTNRLKKHMESRGITWKYDYRDSSYIKDAIEEVKSQFDCRNVAGFYIENGECYWKYNSVDAYFIPLKSPDGSIHSLRMRLYDPIGSNKYILVSTGDTKKYQGGAKNKSAIHFPKRLKVGADIETLRVTEGEIKADVCTQLQKDIYTLSMGGVTFWKNLVAELTPLRLNVKNILICFDADVYSSAIRNDTNLMVSLINTYKELKKIYPDSQVYFEKWDESCGKGIDDVLINKKVKEIKRIHEDNFVEQAQIIESIPEDWIYVVDLKCFYNVVDDGAYDKEQFYDYCSSELPKAFKSKDIIANPLFPVYRSINYDPNGKKNIFEGKKRIYNTFKGLPDIDAVKGDCSPFTEHVRYITGEKYCDIIFDYLAYNVKHIGNKIKWMPVIQGDFGTGKSTIHTIMRLLLGDNNVNEITPDMLREQYTHWAKNKCLIFIHELLSFGRLEVMNKLKTYITESNIQIREMYRNPYAIKNIFNFMAFTNHKDCIRIENGERRYCVIYNDQPAKEPEYYTKLNDWINKIKNLEKIKYFLVNRNLGKFNPHSHAPKTEFMDEVVYRSYSEVEKIVKDSVDDIDIFPDDIVSTNDLVDIIMETNNVRNKSDIWVALDKLRYKKLIIKNNDRIFFKGQKRRFYVIRNYEKYASLNDEKKMNILHHMYSDVEGKNLVKSKKGLL